MHEIGDYLRQAREAKNISLKDIQEATKIRLRYLEAIEEGDFAVIPGEVYLKGFLTNYANAIGLNSQEVLQKYYELKSLKENPIIVEIDEKPAASKVNKSLNINMDGLKGIYLGAAVFLLLILMVGLFIIPYFNGGNSKESNLAASTVVPIQTPITSPEPKISDNNTKENANSPSSTSKPLQTSIPLTESQIVVNATFSKTVWVRVESVDGQNSDTNGTTFYNTSSKQEWHAKNELTLRIGDAEGIHLQFNGKDLGSIGKNGEVKIIKFGPNGPIAP